MMRLLLVAAAALLLPNVVAFSRAVSCDLEHEYSCGFQCIPLEFLCDNVRDCHNGLDEESCEYLHSCPIGDFMCRTGECVSSRFKCNGLAECSDGSDENGCDTLARINVRVLTAAEATKPTLKPAPALLKKPTTLYPHPARITTRPPMLLPAPARLPSEKPVTCLSPRQFHCVHSNQCIPRSQLCDGHQDCEMMEDELECVTVQCLDKEDHRLCHDNTTCLPVDLFCDGVQNCRDGSDELNCEYHNLPTAEDYLLPNLECPSSQFQCGDGQCLDRKLVCDRHVDCVDGSDESGRCDECSSFGCSFGCLNTPKGPECVCPPHMYLSSDFRTCEMTDLCSLEGNKCSQFCRQSYGTVSCHCAPGYKLINQYECVVDEAYETGSLFFTHGQNSVRRTNLFNDTAFYEDYVPPMKIDHISSMSFNPHTHGLYLAVNLGHHETRVMLNNGEMNKWFLSGHRIKHIAVDWITNNLYYAAESHVPSIGVCSPNGRFCTKIYEPVKTDHAHQYHFEGLLFYPKRAQLIFLERHHESPDGAVIVCDADGAYPRRLDHLDIGRKRAIALDYVTDQLYIAAEGIMHRIDLNTLRQHPVEAAVYPRAFAVFNGFYYFIEKETSALKRAKFGEEPVFLHQLQPHDASIAINNSLYYPALPNPCPALSCSHICVLKHRKEGSTPEASCLCPSQYDLVEGKCVFRGHNYIAAVHLSGPRMAELCEVNNICENGGICNKTTLDNGHTKLVCECPVGFTGLYCEIAMPLPEDASSGSYLFLWLSLILIGLLVVTLVVLYRRYPKLRRRVSIITTPTPSPKSTYSKRKTIISPPQELPRTHSAANVNYFTNPVYEDTTSTAPLIETTNLHHNIPRSSSEACIVNETSVTNPLFY